MESLCRRRKSDCFDLAEAYGVEGSLGALFVFGVRGSLEGLLVFGVRGLRGMENDGLTGVDADIVMAALVLRLRL